MVMLLINNNNSEPFKRREQRRACTDNYLDLAAANSLVNIESLTFGKLAVYNPDYLAEICFEPVYKLRCERYFRHKYNCCLSAI